MALFAVCSSYLTQIDHCRLMQTSHISQRACLFPSASPVEIQLSRTLFRAPLPLALLRLRPTRCVFLSDGINRLFFSDFCASPMAAGITALTLSDASPGTALDLSPLSQLTALQSLRITTEHSETCSSLVTLYGDQSPSVLSGRVPPLIQLKHMGVRHSLPFYDLAPLPLVSLTCSSILWFGTASLQRLATSTAARHLRELDFSRLQLSLTRHWSFPAGFESLTVLKLELVDAGQFMAILTGPLPALLELHLDGSELAQYAYKETAKELGLLPDDEGLCCIPPLTTLSLDRCHLSRDVLDQLFAFKMPSLTELRVQRISGSRIVETWFDLRVDWWPSLRTLAIDPHMTDSFQTSVLLGIETLSISNVHNLPGSGWPTVAASLRRFPELRNLSLEGGRTLESLTELKLGRDLEVLRLRTPLVDQDIVAVVHPPCLKLVVPLDSLAYFQKRCRGITVVEM